MDASTHGNRLLIKENQVNRIVLVVTSLSISAALVGCAATIPQQGIEQRTSQAIGKSVGSFTISDQTTSTGGRIDYTVKTDKGGVYRCYLYSATKFQKAMSFGQTPDSDAICTAMDGTTPPPKRPLQ